MKKILPAFLSCQGTSLSDDEKHLFEKYNPLGVCLFSRCCANIESRHQVQNLVREIKEIVGRDDVLIAVDQEGGRVRRLVQSEFVPLLAQADITTVTQARRHAYLAAHDLKSCAINVNFAPVLDVMHEKTSAVLNGRCFAGDASKVARLGRVMVDTYIKHGVCPCVKHMPGHGLATVDPHLNLPIIETPRQQLQNEFYPFKMLHDAPMGMLAHIVLTDIDAENPATLSAPVIQQIIRDEIGFDGMLVSDALMMNALKGSITERAQRSVAAGCDVVCLGNADYAANEELCASGIVMTDEASERMQNVKSVIAKHDDFVKYEHVKNKYCENAKNVVAYDYCYDATEVLNNIR